MIGTTFRAMGTDVVVSAKNKAAAQATKSLFERVEARCSRFRDDSELTAMNLAPGDRVELSPFMTNLIGIAAELRDRTDGLVDAGLGAPLAAWGYDRTFEEVTDRDLVPTRGLESPDWRLEGHTLIRGPGVAIDLGGIAKGWACDRAVDDGLAIMVSAGGDVRSVDPDLEVEIMAPWDGVAATVPLGAGALATSSITRRQWQMGKTTAHHLIDPRTLAPAITPVLTASVVAATAVEAEAGAKSVLLQGADGLAWARDQPWIDGALVVWQDRSIYATKNLKVSA